MAYFQVLVLVVGVLCATAHTNAASKVTTYAGTLDMAPYAKNEALNVTVTCPSAMSHIADDATSVADGCTVEVDWVYDHDAGGQACAPDHESGLKWTVSGNNVMMKGTGKDPSYYSFLGGFVDSAKKTIKGSMVGPDGKPCGTFDIVEGAPMVPSKCKAPPPPPPPPPPHPTTHAFIWPLPKNYTRGSTTLQVVPGTAGFFKLSSGQSPLLSQAFTRYSGLTFQHRLSSMDYVYSGPDAAGTITGLTLTVADLDESHPQLETNESYTLTVPSAGGMATLEAMTVYGALRGLETFSQLVIFDFDNKMYTLPEAPWMIKDEPRFPHRGLMIDSARHFETTASIKMIIDSLPFAKLNVLHWHMSDTQSFPFQVKSYPKLWDAAYSSQEKFTQMDVADVVEHARLRGVRVMVEFDMPGHAGSWCTGYPEICPSTSCTQPLNVANDFTFEVIESLMKECTGGVASKRDKPSPGVFKDNFIHLGGDEVNTACWTSTPSVAKWLNDTGRTADQAYAYFVKKVADMAIAQGHRPVQWSEVFDHFKYNLTKETIVHIWKSVTNVTEVVAGGYNTLVNVGYDKLSWYLDNLNVMWNAVYLNEPCTGVPDNLCPLVLGGHGEMWGETVDTSDLQNTVWPRLASIAERLWSPRDINDPIDAHDRIQYFRCLLNRRGVRAAPVNNPTARSAPKGPGSCFVQ